MNENNEKGVSITEYTGEKQNVVIPEMINNMKVVYIDNRAFRGKTSVKTVTIPKYIEDIGSESFTGCSELEIIKVNSGNKYFTSKGGLLCSADGKILYLVPEGYVGDLVISKDISIISMEAFRNCSDLLSVTFSGNIETVNLFAFKDCDNLKDISFKGDVMYFADESIVDCPKLENINLNNKKQSFYLSEGGMLYKKTDSENGSGSKTLVKCPAGKSGKIILDNTVTSVEDNAFTGCKNIKELTIGKNVSYISGSDLKECKNLKKITVDKSNKFYRFNGGMLFNSEANSSGYENQKAWYVKDNETLVRVLNGKTGRVSVPKTVSKIDGYAFYESGVTEVIIPSSVKRICYGAFMNCESLKSVSIPGSVEEIESETFGGCSDLTTVTIGNGTKTIEDYAFEACGKLRIVKIPESVKDIGNAFIKDSSKEMLPINIYGKSGSYAQNYAKKYRIPFYTGSPILYNVSQYKIAESTPMNKIQVLCDAAGGKGSYT